MTLETPTTTTPTTRATAEPMPLVSIGCAVYNGAETLRRALDGVVSQDYPNIEIIVCDDCSTDGSREICREYASKHANIRYYENEKNIGLIENFNKLFGLAKGAYFLWADQDDVRDTRFVSKCVAVLEEDKDAVLCHSHTAVFWKDPKNVLHVIPIDGVDDEENVLARYWRFLREYSDTAIYGLIRSDALRATGLWRHAPGSSNALLFELLLLGKFRQVPETLYFYSAKGPARPKPKAEHARGSGNRPLPKLPPFLVLARNQTNGILASPRSPAAKGALLALLWGNIVMVNGSKAAFRAVEKVTQRRAPRWLERACSFAVLDRRGIRYVAWPEDWPKDLPYCDFLRGSPE